MDGLGTYVKISMARYHAETRSGAIGTQTAERAVVVRLTGCERVARVATGSDRRMYARVMPSHSKF